VKKRAHSLLEYSIILGIVGVALFAMQTHFKRGIQGMLKVIADDMGPQGDPQKNLAEADYRRQELEALKNKYGFEHQETYTSNAIEYKHTESNPLSLGEGAIITIMPPASITRSTTNSYEIESDYRKPELSQEPQPGFQDIKKAGTNENTLPKP
jgi:hypothetical protein